MTSFLSQLLLSLISHCKTAMMILSFCKNLEYHTTHSRTFNLSVPASFIWKLVNEIRIVNQRHTTWWYMVEVLISHSAIYLLFVFSIVIVSIENLSTIAFQGSWRNSKVTWSMTCRSQDWLDPTWSLLSLIISRTGGRVILMSSC